MTHRIGVIGGDGIGPEVVAEALKVVRAAGVDLDTVDYDLGGARYLRDGDVLPDEVLDEWRGLDALFLGAVGTPDVPPGVIERGLLLKMRFALDLYVNLRPVPRTRRPSTSSSSGRTPRAPTPARAASCARARPTRSPPRARSTPAWASSAASATPSTWPAAAPARHLTLVHKTNVLTFAGDLWQRTFDEVAAEYPDVDHRLQPRRRRLHPLRARTPSRYDVIVTDNLFGDILTDLGGRRLRRHRAGRLGQPEPRPHRPVDVRARARLGPRHRRAPGRPTPPPPCCRRR